MRVMNTPVLKSIAGTIGIGILVAAAVVFRIKPDWKTYCLVGAGVGLALFVLYLVLSWAEVKKALSGRSTMYSANTVLAIAMVLGIIGLLNFLSNRHHKRWDITEGKIHSLSDQSLKVLANLDKTARKVEVNAFFKEGDAPGQKMKDLLTMYQAESRELKVQFYDPAKNPGLAKRFNIEEYNTTVFTSGEKETKITGFGEEEITNALIQVSRDLRKTVYFLEGHGEVNIDAAEPNGYTIAKERLEKENYVVKKLQLATAPAFPHDCAVLVLGGPQVAVTPPELKAIDDYLTSGGRALFMVDPKAGPGLESFLMPWGVRLGEDIIVDRVSRVFGGDELMPIVTAYEEHDLTKKFNYATFYPLARSVDTAEKNDRGATDTVVGRSSEQSWAETDPKLAEFNEGKDRLGPIPLIVAVTAEGKKREDASEPGESEKKLEENPPQTRMVVFGDSDFANNTYYSFSGNMNLFLNTVAWLAEEEDLISIRPSTQAPKTIALSREQASLIFWSTIIILPALVLVAGTGVWMRRRNK